MPFSSDVFKRLQRERLYRQISESEEIAEIMASSPDLDFI